MTAKLAPAKLALAALKWTAVAVWLDLTERVIGAPLDRLFAATPLTAWLDGVTQCISPH